MPGNGPILIALFRYFPGYARLLLCTPPALINPIGLLFHDQLELLHIREYQERRPLNMAIMTLGKNNVPRELIKETKYSELSK